ncbi:MAG TPA: TOBE domain-containing protein, partial [Gemmatimonadales bacterium]
YERPASLFVATFVGRANVLKNGVARVLGGAPGEVLVIRPEALRFGSAGVAGVVRERRYTGVAAFYVVEAESGERLEVMAEPGAAAVGARVHVGATRAFRFPA